jgi:ribonuclease P protein component
MPTFCKEERLCNRRHIFLLQKEASVFYSYPFTIKWMELTNGQESNVRILPAVAKRNFRKAVDRNRIKHIIREAYRLNKELFVNQVQSLNKNIVIMFLYTGKNIVTYQEAETKIVLILQKIADNL